MSGTKRTPNRGINRITAAFVVLVATVALGLGVGSAGAAAGDGPMAAFTFPDVVHAGNQVQFDARTSTASGQITNYTWDFGDGSMAEGASALAPHTFAVDGHYVVRLTITVQDCSACDGLVASHDVTVTDPGLEITDPKPGLGINFMTRKISAGPTRAATFTIRSSGKTTVTITQIAITGDPDHQFLIVPTGTCASGPPGALDPGAVCTVDVVFDPSIARRTNATLTVSSDAGDSPQTRAIWGTGTGSAATNNCKKVHIKRTEVHAPTGKAKGRKPGLAVSIKTSSAAIVRVRIRVTYRRSGQLRTLIYKEKVLRINNNGLLSVAIPKGLRPTLHRGKKVVMEVRTKIRTPKQGCSFSKPNTIIFETQVA